MKKYVILAVVFLLTASVNAQDSLNCREIGYYDTPGYALDVAVSGDYACVADGDSGLRVISVSDPTNPQEVGYYDTPGCALGVAVLGGYACLADHDAGLRVISISDPTNPQEVGYYDPPGYAIGVAVSGGYAYVADGYSGLRIIEFFVPGIEERGTLDARISKLNSTVVRNVLMIGSRGQGGGSRLCLLDVSGRKMMELKPGENDIRHIAPGVYFVVTPSPFSSPPEGERNKERGRSASSVHKVIITE